MWWRRTYKYIPYEAKDETYFGCGTVVRAEWDYIAKRRASQAAAEAEESGEPAPKEERQTGTDAPPNLRGIALSGGGIRSASFCLGVLQALAYAGWLKKLDYLSTVSGGGYIGGSISWLLHKKWKGVHGEEIPYGLGRKNFPYGSYPMVGMEDKPAEAQAAKPKADNWNVYKGRMLRYLRQHARYLTPGNGINFMSLLAVVLRNTLFSLFVYGGVLIVLFALAWPYLFHPAESAWGFAQIRNVFDWFPAKASRAQGAALLLALCLLLAAAVYVVLTFLLPKSMNTGYRLRYFYERWMGRLLTLALALALIGFVPAIYCWIDEAGRDKASTGTIHISAKDAELGDISFSGHFKRAERELPTQGVITLSGKSGESGEISVTGDIKPGAQAEPGQKADWSASAFGGKVAALVGALSTLLSAIASLLAFVQAGKRKKKLPTGVLVAVASFALIFGLLLLAYHFAALLRAEVLAAGGMERAMSFPRAMFGELGLWAGAGIVLLLFLRLPNLNDLSIHRYYRDRLMETFTPDLPDAIHLNGPVPGAAKSADHTPLHEMLKEEGGPGELGPYHLINANIVLVSSKIPKFRGRGGDNFILSPKYCGSNATGWCETKHSPYHFMTLPTATAISGAAVHSNAGSGGVGITRAPWLSFLMGFFNIRLGYWSDNPTPGLERLRRIAAELDRPLARPQRDGQRAWHYALTMLWHGLFVAWRWPLNRLVMLLQGLLCVPWLAAGRNRPNAIYPGMLEMYLRKNLDENSRMVQLSDGGHFENLGLYELIRRRLKLIIVCDGTADTRYGFDDLANALEKVRADFGTIIDFRCADAEALTPASVLETGAETGPQVTYAKRGYLIGRIKYNDREEGTLIFLTTTLFKELSVDVYAYRKAHDEFPDQPTGDQFFDEKQFEAYRELGYQTAHKMMCDEDVVNNWDVKHILGVPEIGCPREWRR